MGAGSSEPTRVEVAERFRDAGLKATPQRVAIYRALCRTTSHPGPEGIYRAVRPTLPSISLATVYKTLDTLVGAGLVEQVSPIGETKRYDANKAPHHHLVCTECHAIEDIYLPEPIGSRPAPDAFPGFHVTGLHIQVLGLCEGCYGRNTK